MQRTTQLRASLLLVATVFAGNARADLCTDIKAKVQEGDVLFTEITAGLFEKVARVSGGWAAHTGIAFRDTGGNWVVAESTTPISRISPLCSFTSNNPNHHMAVGRLKRGLSISDISSMKRVAMSHQRIPYDIYFDYDNESKTYCSKFVHTVFEEALGVRLGKIQTLGEIVKNYEASPNYNPQDIEFFAKHYGGTIPAEQRAVTPHAVYADTQLEIIFENR